MSFPWLKGHGTENDFVLLPDHDGTIHGELGGAFVAALCHRRRGIGADGVMRSVRHAPLGSRAANFAFDVTPARLVSGLITEHGVVAAEEGALRRLMEGQR